MQRVGNDIFSCSNIGSTGMGKETEVLRDEMKNDDDIERKAVVNLYAFDRHSTQHVHCWIEARRSMMGSTVSNQFE